MTEQNANIAYGHLRKEYSALREERDALRLALALEREACAKVCFDPERDDRKASPVSYAIYNAIRALPDPDLGAAREMMEDVELLNRLERMFCSGEHGDMSISIWFYQNYFRIGNDDDVTISKEVTLRDALKVAIDAL